MKHLIQSLISPLAEGYAELYKEQKNFVTLKKCGKEEFFGLRDFYRCKIVSVTLLLVCCLISLTVSFVSCSVLNLFCLAYLLSLIKMVYSMAAKSGERPRWHQLEHAIKRNFGGLVEGEPVQIFKRYYPEREVSLPFDVMHRCEFEKPSPKS